MVNFVAKCQHKKFFLDIEYFCFSRRARCQFSINDETMISFKNYCKKFHSYHTMLFCPISEFYIFLICWLYPFDSEANFSWQVEKRISVNNVMIYFWLEVFSHCKTDSLAYKYVLSLYKPYFVIRSICFNHFCFLFLKRVFRDNHWSSH